jgi:hypothetical protein
MAAKNRRKLCLSAVLFFQLHQYGTVPHSSDIALAALGKHQNHFQEIAQDDLAHPIGCHLTTDGAVARMEIMQ